ncbi:hypothetical protein ACJQWK_09081 [Exserohilum turcicum]|uniref:Uncharacterized protein n=1 Tax=Exserohilum turcicum (strain 28A) TaxID=671987 RepID=R0IQI3_EXST2|nr:uncharacterized protein SETTUDRAFT_89345 [Exserohilum turcica Et28A]EOA87145.1 hypothetical protein SETTUDRAFT_89345 [Exserohilum turcica Et28A]
MAPNSADVDKLAESYMAGFLYISLCDYLALRAHGAPTSSRPPSLGSPAPQNNYGFAEHVKNNLHPILITRFPLAANEMHMNEAGKQVTIWTADQPEFKPEFVAALGNKELTYIADFVFVLDVNDESKMLRVLELIDILATDSFRVLVEKAYGISVSDKINGQEVHVVVV